MACNKEAMIKKVARGLYLDIKATNPQKSQTELKELAFKQAEAMVQVETDSMVEELEVVAEESKKAPVDGYTGFVSETNALGVTVTGVTENGNVLVKYPKGDVTYPTDPKLLKLKSDNTTVNNLLQKYTEVNEMYGNTEGTQPKDFKKFDRVENDVHGNIDKMIELMKELDVLGNSKESARHLKYLEGLLGEMNQSFFDKMTVFINTEANKSGGTVTAKAIKLNVGKQPRAVDNEMSDAEIYVHEIIHSMIMHARKDNTRASNIAKRKLQYVMDKALEKMKWEDFLPETSVNKKAEEKVAKEMFDYIFYSKSAEDEFIAHVLTNPIVMKAAKTIDIKEDTATITLYDRIAKLFSTFMDILGGNYSFKDKGNNVYEQTRQLAFELAESNSRAVKKANDKLNVASRLWDGFQKYNQRSGEVLQEWWGKYVDAEKYTKPPKGLRARSLWMAKMMFKMISNQDYRKAFEMILSGYGLKPQGDVQSIFRDFFKGDELTQQVDMYALASDKIDTAKNTLVTAVAELAHKGFNRSLSETEEVALTKVLIDTDLSSISKKFNSRTLNLLLKDDVEINRRISRAIDMLKVIDKDNYNWHKTQALGLGHFMVTNNAHPAQALNAENIASGVLSSKRRKPNKKIVALIDEIATLTALKETGSKHRVLVRKMLRANRNGVENLMNMHAEFKTDSKNRVFKDNQVNMIKGYSKEVFDDRTSMIVAPVADAKELMREGYILKTKLTKSIYDKNTEPMGMYIADAYETSEWYRTAIRLTGMKGRGTTIKEIVGKEGDEFSFKKAEAIKEEIEMNRRRIAKQIEEGTFTRAETDYGLIPILDEDGYVTDFRYMMSKSNKEELLKQKLNVSEVLSKSFAHSMDKEETEIQNEKVLNVILDDMTDNYIPDKKYGKNLKEYIVISKIHKDKEIEELYKVLPNSFKNAIGNSAKGRIAVRADLLHSYFGYRHVSVANSKVLKKILPKELMRIIKIAEKMWMEFIKISKIDILIKMPVVIIGNIISNAMYAISTGTSPVTLVKEYINSVREVNLYFKRHTELVELELAKKTGNIQKQDLRRIDVLKRQLQESSIHELSELGIYQSIVEDMDHKELDSTNKIKRGVDEQLNKLPKVVKDGVNLLYLTEHTSYYKLMNAMLTKSDLVARDIENRKLKIIQEKQANGTMPLPKWYVTANMTEKQKANYKPVNRKLTGAERKDFMKQADKHRHETILNVFINYNKPSGRWEEYLNKMGAIMFTKYAKRIQRVITETGVQNPLNVGSILMGEAFMFGDVETIFDQSLFTRSWYNLGVTDSDWIPGTNPIDRIMEVMNPPLVQLVVAKNYG